MCVGAFLSVGVFDSCNNRGCPFYINRNNNGEIEAASPGIFVEIMDELASRAGFSWRDNYGVVFQPR